MNCSQARRVLTLDGDPTPVLNRHLTRCVECRELAVQLEEDREALGSLRDAFVAHADLLDLRQRVLREIARPSARGGFLLQIERAVRTGHRLRYAAVGLAIALATAGVLLGVAQIGRVPAPDRIAFAPPSPPAILRPAPAAAPAPTPAGPITEDPDPESVPVRFVETFDPFEPPPLEVMDLSLINAEDTEPDRILVKFTLEDPNITILWLADDAATGQGGV